MPLAFRLMTRTLLVYHLQMQRANVSGAVMPGTRAAVALLRGDYFSLRLDRFLGTFAPLCLASDSPIAIACLRLLTCLPDLPDFNAPRLRSCIALLTFWLAFFPYFRPDRFRGILPPRGSS